MPFDKDWIFVDDKATSDDPDKTVKVVMFSVLNIS